MSFETKTGDEAAHALDGEWLQVEGGTFGHGCCRCSLFHQVSYRVVDGSGVQVDGVSLQLQFTIDPEETARLEEYKKEVV